MRSKLASGRFASRNAPDYSGEPVVQSPMDVPLNVPAKLKLLCVNSQLKLAEYLRKLGGACLIDQVVPGGGHFIGGEVIDLHLPPQ